MLIIIPIILMIMAIVFLVLGLILEIGNDGDEAYDNAVIVIFVLSVIMFWIAAATFLFVTETAVIDGELIEFKIESYKPITWLNVGLSFIPIVFLVVKTTNLLGAEEE
jgi:hypothetical protein